MESRTYVIGEKEVVVTDKKILDIVERAENVDISPREASKMLSDYLLSDGSGSVSEYFERVRIWEAITKEFDTPRGSRSTSLHERYAEKHDLSGRLTI